MTASRNELYDEAELIATLAITLKDGSLPSAFTEGHCAKRSTASVADRTLGTKGRQSTQLLLSRASSTAASSCCMSDGATKAVCRGMPSGKRPSRCPRALVTPSFDTVSYLHSQLGSLNILLLEKPNLEQ